MVSVVWGVNKNDQIYTRQPGSGLALTSAEKSLIMSEVLEGLTFLATADPDANVSFIQDWRDISVTAAPGAGHDYESFEAPWRNAALQAMGFAASRSGSLAYVTSLRTNQRTDWAYVADFTEVSAALLRLRRRRAAGDALQTTTAGAPALNQPECSRTKPVTSSAPPMSTATVVAAAAVTS